MIITLDNCNVCITGTLRKMVRETAFNRIKAEGGFPQRKISQKTDFLVVADEVMKYPTYKFVKAGEWWIDCITEDDFYELIGEEL